MKRHFACLFLVCLALPQLLHAAPPAVEPPIPFPETAALEPDVAEQIGEARRRLDERLAEPQTDPAELATAFGELGMVYHAYSLREAAEAAYRNAIRLAAKNARWSHYLGLLLQEVGRLDEAAAAYARAVELVPRDVPALVYQAEVLRQQGRPDQAETLARQALAVDPACTAAKALLGQAALDRRDFRAAAGLFTEALTESPQADRLHYLLAMAYRGLGESAKAGEHLALSGPVGVRPFDPWLDELAALRSGERVRLAHGKTAFDAGRFADAAEQFRLALEARPESIEARLNLAVTLTQLGRQEEAVAHLRETLRRAPDHANAHYNLGAILAAQGTAAAAQEAVQHLSMALAARPSDVQALRLRARLLRDLGRQEEALADYARAVELEPAEETTLVGRAETLVRLGRYREARQRLEEAHRLLPQSGAVTFGLARLLAACPDLALRDGAKALDLGTALWEARPTASHAETVAMALGELGRCDEAARWQHTAIEAAGGANAENLAAALPVYEGGAPCRYGVPPS